MAEIYQDMVPADELVSELTRVFTIYKHHRNVGEAMGDFCHRIGIENLRAHCAELKNEEVTI
jgi:sulfite reductase (ferredoxin)